MLLGRKFLHAADDARVDDGVEQLELLGIGKYCGAEFLPVNVAAGIEDIFPEALQDFLIGGAAGFDDLVSNAVGVDDVRAQLLEVLRHGAFSAGDASGEAEGESEVRGPGCGVKFLQGITSKRCVRWLY